jgi:hypothetical protein
VQIESGRRLQRTVLHYTAIPQPSPATSMIAQPNVHFRLRDQHYAARRRKGSMLQEAPSRSPRRSSYCTCLACQSTRLLSILLPHRASGVPGASTRLLRAKLSVQRRGPPRRLQSRWLARPHLAGYTSLHMRRCNPGSWCNWRLTGCELPIDILLCSHRSNSSPSSKHHFAITSPATLHR